ncbi:LppX_LprAFG lipoprotein [Mycobacterium sp. SMC-4]|uniref:LppX_LprAFG lipoprotein n=1 Tax=Mycobacterium sp. SMC-4 TaxID=2857059 RepID=UPI0021B275D5|nr:LppX_LprAFG lipoprotein [Mycobacterium sp. SMC-4]UXA20224.1 LppX_LprAFG lipoprotein [Mycobacterium sp. SMC-4]
MQTRLSATFVALIAALVFVAGCSSSPEDSGRDLPDAATLLTESSQTTKGQSSAHLSLSVQGQLADLPVESLEGELTQSPSVAAKGTADIVFMGQRLQGVDFVVSDGDLYAALTSGGNLSNFGPASDVYDVAAILDPNVGLANVLANFTDATADGRETIDGVGTVRITGNVSADAVNKIAPQIAATAPVPGTAWVAEDGDHELMQARLEPSPGNSVTMTLTKWGEPVEIENPAVR